MTIASGVAAELRHALRNSERALPSEHPKFTDFTLADFEELSERDRLLVLAKSVNEPIRAAAHLSLMPEHPYGGGAEIRRAVFGFFGAVPEWIALDNAGVGRFLPTCRKSYWSYVHDVGPGTGMMTALHLTAQTNESEPRYVLTSFGKAMQGYVASVLSSFAAAGVNPTSFFGATSRRQGCDPQENSIRFLLHTYNNDKDMRPPMPASEVATLLFGDPTHSVALFLDRFDRSGVITYDSVNAKIGERKSYAISTRWAKKIASGKADISAKTCKAHFIGRGTITKVVKALADSGASSMTGEELNDLAPKNRPESILAALADLHILHLSRSRSAVAITTKGKILVEDILLPMVALSKDPSLISLTKDAQVGAEDRSTLLNLYGAKKQKKGRGRRLVLKSLPIEGTGTTAEECAKATGLNRGTVNQILSSLQTEGLAVNVPGCRWLKVVRMPATRLLKDAHRSGQAQPSAPIAPRKVAAR